MSWSSALGLAGSVVGGLFGSSSQKKAQEANYQMQKEFAQNGIRWKVADAKAAGLHPLVALGAQTHSPSAVYSGEDYSWMGSAGQNVGRAIEAKQTKEERDAQETYNQVSRNLNLRRMELENALLESQISSINRTALPPAMPSISPSRTYQTAIDGQGDSTIPEYITVKDKNGRKVTMMNPDIASAGIEEDFVGTIQRALRSGTDAIINAIPDKNGDFIYPLTGVHMNKNDLNREFKFIGKNVLRALKRSGGDYLSVAKKFLKWIGSHHKKALRPEYR